MRELDLRATKIKGSGISYLGSMHHLEDLALGNTKVSDRALSDLEKLTSLKHLHLSFTEVTREGADRLRDVLPECEVVR